MVQKNAMPKETLAELISFLADNESFGSVKKSLADGMTVEEVRDALRTHALDLKCQAVSEAQGCVEILKGCSISRKTKEVLSCLSSYEEEKLLRAFGFTEGS